MYICLFPRRSSIDFLRYQFVFDIVIILHALPATSGGDRRIRETTFHDGQMSS